MSGVNKAIVVGRLGQDPEAKEVNDTTITNFSVATSYKPEKGEEKTEWHRCVAFGKLAENIAEYCKKGKQVYVEGRLQTRKWTDKEEVERYSTEIVAERVQFLGDAKRDEGSDEAPKKNGGGSKYRGKGESRAPF